MARIIKTYPPTSRFNEDIIAQADRIKDIFMPEYNLKSFAFDSLEKKLIVFEPSCYALDDTPGVHIKMIQKNASEDFERLETKEIIVDEIEFCDAVYDCVKDNKKISNNTTISKIFKNILNDFSISDERGDIWFFDTHYKGFGVICGGEDSLGIIATIDTVVFQNDAINLLHCVGNYNLNNVKNCCIYFSSGNKSFTTHSFLMKEVSNDEDGCCTYKIAIEKETSAVSPPIDLRSEKQRWASFTPYEDSVEKFIEDRLQYLEEVNNDDEEKKENIYDLL